MPEDPLPRGSSDAYVIAIPIRCLRRLPWQLDEVPHQGMTPRNRGVRYNVMI